MTWPDETAQSFTFSNTTAYTWYRLSISVGGTAPGTCDIGEWTLNGQPNTATPYPGEMWVVVKPTGTGNPLTRFSGNQGSHFPWSDGVIYENWGMANYRAEVYPGAIPIANQWRIYRVTSTGTEWRSYLDNSPRTGVNGQALGWFGQVTVGGATGAPFQGQVAEVLIRRTLSTPTEIAKITGYLNAKHGLTAPTT